MTIFKSTDSSEVFVIYQIHWISYLDGVDGIPNDKEEERGGGEGEDTYLASTGWWDTASGRQIDIHSTKLD